MNAPLWWAGVLICAVCDRAHAAVCPVVDNPDSEHPPEPEPGSECPSCGAMACVIKVPDPEDYVRGY